MTHQIPTPDPGDWIVYVAEGSGGAHPAETRPLGGPYVAAAFVAFVAGRHRLRVKPQRGPEITIFLRNVRAVVLTRGEAERAVTRLRAVQTDYIAERDALEPKFLQRVIDVLANA